MSPQSEKATEQAKNNAISINEQIEYLRTLKTDESNKIIATLSTILERYTSEKELVHLTLPKEKWAAFHEFEKHYTNGNK